MPDEAAVLDVPEISPAVDIPSVTGDEPVVEETPLGTEDGVDPEQGTEPDETLPETTDADGTAPFTALVANGKLLPAVQKALDTIKATDPKLANALRKAAFHADTLHRDFGGFPALKAMKEQFESLGGAEGIPAVMEEVTANRQLDEHYIAGDSRALEMMTRTPQLQEGFVKMAPAAFQKFAELHPAGWQQYVASAIHSDMLAAKLPLALERLADFLPEDPRAQQAWKQVMGYVDGLANVASKKVEAPKFGQPADPQAASIETREINLRRSEWQMSAQQTAQPIFNKAWTDNLAGRKITQTQMETIKELYDGRVGQAIQKESAKLDRYLKAGDRDGFMKAAKAINDTAIGDSLRSAFNRVLGERPGPKAGTPPPKNGVPGKVTPEAGFTVVAKAPAFHEIDRQIPFNTKENFMAGKAVLIGGKKVTWQT